GLGLRALARRGSNLELLLVGGQCCLLLVCSVAFWVMVVVHALSLVSG
ncbi:hypothetical protein P3T35_008107, partial [Kitasatospora sp. GP30]|nr:hypothetical protein [Kitasatospora sp. GP30]